MFIQVLKNLLHCVEHNARILLFSQHGVSLTSSCLPIRKYGGVVAIKHTLTKEFGCVSEDFQLRSGIIKCIVERVLLFFGPVLTQDLFFSHHIGWVH